VDSVGLLQLADVYCVPRLIDLCELYITIEVDRSVSRNIEKSDIDVIGLLLTSQVTDCCTSSSSSSASSSSFIRQAVQANSTYIMSSSGRTGRQHTARGVARNLIWVGINVN